MHYAFEKCPMIQDTYDWIMFEWLNAERLKALNPETTRLCGSARSAWEYGQEKKKGVQEDKLLQTDVWYDKGSEADVTRSMEAKSGTASLAMPLLLIRHIPCQNHSLKGTSHKPQTTWLEQKTGRGSRTNRLRHVAVVAGKAKCAMIETSIYSVFRTKWYVGINDMSRRKRIRLCRGLRRNSFFVR